MVELRLGHRPLSRAGSPCRRGAQLLKQRTGYEPFYHLSGKPFQLSPDPSFFYESHVNRRAHAYLEYGLYQGEGFIVITGEVDAGKTIYVQKLLAHLYSTQVIAAHLVSPQLDADDLLRAVATALGLRAKDTEKGLLLAEVEQFLRQLAAVGRCALLVVDAAQDLTPRAVEELRMLSNFSGGPSGQAGQRSTVVHPCGARDAAPAALPGGLPPEQREQEHQGMLAEIRSGRAGCSRGHSSPRAGKRKMSGYQLRKRGQPLHVREDVRISVG